MISPFCISAICVEKKRILPYETFSAVNRIDKPQILRVKLGFARFLAAGKIEAVIESDVNILDIASLHDVNLAVRFADRCLLLHGDGRWDLGRTAEILSSERLSELYATKMEAVNWRTHQLFVASGDVIL